MCSSAAAVSAPVPASAPEDECSLDEDECSLDEDECSLNMTTNVH
jgi:hypothetical protein